MFLALPVPKTQKILLKFYLFFVLSEVLARPPAALTDVPECSEDRGGQSGTKKDNGGQRGTKGPDGLNIRYPRALAFWFLVIHVRVIFGFSFWGFFVYTGQFFGFCGSLVLGQNDSIIFHILDFSAVGIIWKGFPDCFFILGPNCNLIQ